MNASTTDALFRQLVQQGPDAMIYADREGVIRLWNPAAERIFGFSAEEALGASLDIIIPERFRDPHWSGFRRSMDTGHTKYAGRSLTTRSVHKDGRKLYVEMSFGMIRDEAGAVIGALATARDCTERHLAAARPPA